MKLLAISDTHGRIGNSQKIIEKLGNLGNLGNLGGRINGVLHMGDMLSDARFLEQNYPKLDFHYVAGNCDVYTSVSNDLPLSRIVEYNNIRIFMSHGHMYSIKRGYQKLVSAAKEHGAQIAICGHTHEPLCKTVDDILVLNPGSIEFPRGEARFPSYAVITIEADGKYDAGIVSLNNS